jgi:fatty acid desaturase
MQTIESNQPWIPPGADIAMDKQALKKLMRRSDAIPLARLAVCLLGIGLLGWVYAQTFGHGTFWVMLFVFGGVSSVFIYSLSHECSHGTAFKSRWLNETVFWCVSLLFGQEVLYRRYTHASHHTYTMYVGKDAQLPLVQPIKGLSYVIWYTGVYYHYLFMKIMVLHSVGLLSDRLLECAPAAELPKIKRNSQIFLAIYTTAAAVSIYFHSGVLIWFWLLPKLAGDPIMMAFAGSQHFEKTENVHDLRESTRSLRPNPLIDLFYWNMSYHIEHHLYPTVPFHALPKLNALIRHALPEPKSLIGTTVEIVSSWFARATARTKPEAEMH